MKNFLKIFKSFKNYFFQNIYLNSIERKFIRFNKNKWKKDTSQVSSKKIILIEMFNWYPWIYFWSYLTNIISKRQNANIKFYYFNLYDSFFSSFSIYILKLKKIFYSFNVTYGVTEYDISELSKNKKIIFNNMYKKFISSKENAVKFKYKDVIIGDLIYDTYLRQNFSPTINLKDERLKKIFLKALMIFDLMENYYKKNKIKCLIPSDLAYTPYGIPVRVANKFNIPIIKIRSENRGLSSFQLIKLDNYLVDEMPYYNFKKFDLKKKINLLSGKKIIINRLSGNYDKKLPYMSGRVFKKHSTFNIAKIKNFNKDKKTIIIFPHCFYDNPHRFRYMIFNDFYEHAEYFLKWSKIYKNYNWLYKPHPNELLGNKNYHDELRKKYPNVIFLNKYVSHHSLLKLKLKCVITNHGTLAHEYAYFKVPVINTGDNPHINYKFCLHIKNKMHLKLVMGNLSAALKRINYNKNEIYEFMYLNYVYFRNLHQESKLIKDFYFVDPIKKNNANSSVLIHHMKNDHKNKKNIITYVENFLNSNNF